VSTRVLALALALGVAATPALADDGARRVRDPEDTWKSLARDPEDEIAQRAYDQAMFDGDTHLDLAVAATMRASREKELKLAIESYEAATRARPDAPEPHFRAAAAILRFYLECNPHEAAALCRGADTFQRHARRVIRHWDAFEAKAPLDPRLEDDILFERAILHTKLATAEHLAHARDDYKKLLARVTPRQNRFGALASGNLAETEMMLGDLDAAIIQYGRTLELAQGVSLYFGLAVALDRDEQGQQARTILRSFGIRGVRDLEAAIVSRDVFYVPEGEAYYYLALGYEANGIDEAAIRYYDEFLASGAHPQFAPRARANRAALVERRSKRKPVDATRDWERGAPIP